MADITFSQWAAQARASPQILSRISRVHATPGISAHREHRTHNRPPNCYPPIRGVRAGKRLHSKGAAPCLPAPGWPPATDSRQAQHAGKAACRKKELMRHPRGHKQQRYSPFMDGGEGRICHRNAPLPESHHLKTDSALSRSKSVRKEDDLLQEPPPGRKCNATVINSPEKKYTGRGVLHRGLERYCV